MARVLPAFPAGTVKHSGYPWAEWSDGRVWAVMHGEDYHCTHASLRTMAYDYARAHGFHARTNKLDEDGQQVGWAIQFTRNGNGGSA